MTLHCGHFSVKWGTITLTSWFTTCSLIASLFHTSFATVHPKEETASVRFMSDVTRVDDVLIPQRPATNYRHPRHEKGKDENSKEYSGLVSYASSLEANPENKKYEDMVTDEENKAIESEENNEGDNYKTSINADPNHKDVQCVQGLFPTANFSNPSCSQTNGSLAFGQRRYSRLYNTVACTLSAIIFTFGILGNILVIIVISRTRSMHTTTNCYLLSLSVADSLVLLAATLPAIPETFFRVDEWPYGRVMCSMLIFLQYLGVDSSSLSITAFTIERYIAICHPMRAQTMCTLSRAKKIIAALWAFTILYCSPWLGLTEIKVYSVSGQEPMYRCQHRLARSSYLLLYMIDLILFYVIPLIIAIILYLLIGRILFFSRTMSKNIQFTGRGMPRKVSKQRTDSKVQVVRMLVVVVVVFATLWMPYRVMVVYNSFAQNKYMDLWFLLFARTMVYTNCAINPILYNIMSVKFKRAFRNYLSCWHRRESLPPSSYNEMNTDVWATRRNTHTNNTALRPPQQHQHQQHQKLNNLHHQHPQHPQPSSDVLRFSNSGRPIPDDSPGKDETRSVQSSRHNSNASQKQKLISSHVPDNVVHVHHQDISAKNSNSSSILTTSDTNSSPLIENTV